MKNSDDSRPLPSPAHRQRSRLSLPFKSPVIPSQSGSVTPQHNETTPRRHVVISRRAMPSPSDPPDMKTLQTNPKTSLLRLENKDMPPVCSNAEPKVGPQECSNLKLSWSPISTTSTALNRHRSGATSASRPIHSETGATHMAPEDAGPSDGIKRKHSEISQSDLLECQKQKQLLLEQIKVKEEHLRQLKLVKMYRSKVCGTFDISHPEY